MIMIRFITCNLSRIVSLIFSTQNNQSDKLKFIIFAVNTVLVENFFVDINFYTKTPDSFAGFSKYWIHVFVNISV